jgi:hypothetical protein
MGRHSHPDDLLDDTLAEPAPDPDSSVAAENSPPVSTPQQPVLNGSAHAASAPAATAKVHKTSAVADLQLVLHRPRLLALCVVAAVLPFVVYFVVVFAVHKTHDWPLFVGAPLVLAGIMVGALLDREYSRANRSAAAAVAELPADDAATDLASAAPATPDSH